jgi:putative hemolysin
MPPLIKGYLRVGGVVGDGAVIDYDFNTIDVNIIVETATVTAKYLNHYSRDSENGARYFTADAIDPAQGVAA